MEFNKYIDHTLLKATATADDIVQLCLQAKEYGFASVCINPCYVGLAKAKLNDCGVKVCTVVGFPLGQNSTETKVFEAKKAIENGADELDVVINISKVLDGDYGYVTSELKALRDATIGKILKIIIETCYLNKEQIVEMTKICITVGADFVKTSTGFGTQGAVLEDIELIKSVCGDKIGIKASGGIKTKEFAHALITSGATRIGTSNGVALMK